MASVLRMSLNITCYLASDSSYILIACSSEDRMNRVKASFTVQAHILLEMKQHEKKIVSTIIYAERS